MTTFAPLTDAPVRGHLTSVVTDLATARSTWRPLVRYGEHARWWTRLDTPAAEGEDVWLLSWLREQGTELHDHGDASGTFIVVKGTLEETRIDGEGRQVTRLLRRGDVSWLDRGDLHDVRNPYTAPAVSIHAYSPALRSMTYFARHEDGRLSAVRTESVEAR
jgi:mannose-6-phosphate isomerase-like protein (cupin superfamily)